MEKLTNKELEEIGQMLKDGISCLKIAEKYGVSKGHISSIRCGNTQKHIAEKYNLTRKQIHTEKISPEKVHEVCKLLIKKYKMKEISEIVGCTVTTVSNIRRGCSYSDISSKYVLPVRNYKALSDDIIISICDMMMEGYSDKYIADLLNKNGISVTRSQICGIRNKRYYKRITSNYDIPKSQFYITEARAKEVCELLSKGLSDRRVSKELHVSDTTVNKIRRGLIMKHISKNYKIPKHTHAHLLEKDIRKICLLLEEGLSPMEISEKLKIGYQRIYNIYKRKRYTDITKEYNF